MKRLFNIKKLLLVIAVIFSMAYTATGQTMQQQDERANTPVPFTLADRDRIMRTEQKLDAFEKSVDQRFESIDQRFKNIKKNMDDRFSNVLTLLYFLLGGMISLFGFVLWDRRSAITPVQREQKRVIEALQQYAKYDEKLHEILRKTWIL